MVCTESVEEVIDKHYSDQIEELEQSGEEESLLNSIREFHAEEVEHETIAREEMDEISPMMKIFKDVVKIGCKTAIKISEKI
jgi:ubiquinone biosynthesis monooxygenase Coq7